MEYLQHLEAQRRQNPQAALLLIQEYENILAQWPPDPYSEEDASIQANLGRIYFELPVGDPKVTLARAINCYQEAFQTCNASGKRRLPLITTLVPSTIWGWPIFISNPVM